MQQQATQSDDDFDFEARVLQRERCDRERRQARARMRRHRAARRAKEAEATRPRRKFIDYREALSENPNYSKLGLTDRRILDLLVNEHARHLGIRTEVIVTYNGLVAGDVSRRLIKASLTKLEALDFESVTWGLGGRKGRVANRFRLLSSMVRRTRANGFRCQFLYR